jgi:hypothetical protein
MSNTQSPELVGELVPYAPIGSGIDPKAAGRAAKNVLDIVDEVRRTSLVEGQDFGTFPGIRGPVLTKSGGEKLALAFNIFQRHSDPVITYDKEGDRVGITSECTLYRYGPDGKELEIATSHSYAGYDEKQFIYKDGRAPWNTIMRMAEKRAFIAAVRTATGTSGQFGEEGAGVDIAPTAWVDVTRQDLIEQVRLLANELGAPGSEPRLQLVNTLRHARLPDKPSEMSTAQLVQVIGLINTQPYLTPEQVAEAESDAPAPVEDDYEQPTMIPPSPTHGTRAPRKQKAKEVPSEGTEPF